MIVMYILFTIIIHTTQMIYWLILIEIWHLLWGIYDDRSHYLRLESIKHASIATYSRWIYDYLQLEHVLTFNGTLTYLED